MSDDVKEQEPQPDPPEPEESAENEDDGSPLHPLQKLLDNPWLLLALGFFVPFLSYTVWGWIELLLTKPAELP